MNQDEMLDDLAERIQQMQVKARAMAQKRNQLATLKHGFYVRDRG